jgi:hypothetical protein
MVLNYFIGFEVSTLQSGSFCLQQSHTELPAESISLEASKREFSVGGLKGNPPLEVHKRNPPLDASNGILLWRLRKGTPPLEASQRESSFGGLTQESPFGWLTNGILLWRPHKGNPPVEVSQKDPSAQWSPARDLRPGNPSTISIIV